jgi:hypothetical protein
MPVRGTGAVDDGPPIPSIQTEVHTAADAIFVRLAHQRIGLARRPKQCFPKKLGVDLRQPRVAEKTLALCRPRGCCGSRQ